MYSKANNKRRKGQKDTWKGRGEEDSTDHVLDAALLAALYQHILFLQNNLTD